MRTGTRMFGLAAGVCLAVAVAGPNPGGRADARGANPSSLRVVAINVEGRTALPLNQVIEIRFNKRVAPSSLTNGSIAIRRGYPEPGTAGEARPVELERLGNVVRLIPTLPTHARDPDDPAGDFFAPGSPGDDAFGHGTLGFGTLYRVVVAGGRDHPAVSDPAGGKLRRRATAYFRTADDDSVTPAFLQELYDQEPPPSVRFTNPPDRMISVDGAYADPGGTPEVPTAARISLFLGAVPLDPRTVRAAGAVELLRVGIDAPPSPVPGDVFLEQDRNGASLTFRPLAPLDPFSTYALRIDESVTELSGGFEVSDHAERRRLLRAYGYLAASRVFFPERDPEEFVNPPSELTFDWPDPYYNTSFHGALKRNLLEIGDTRPWEIDPRVYVIFTTGSAELSVPGAASIDPNGATRGSRRLARVTRVETPLGLQGTAGAGVRIIVPMTLVGRRGRRAEVEVQFGFDADASGAIDEQEFLGASLDWIDPRDRELVPFTVENRRRDGADRVWVPRGFDTDADGTLDRRERRVAKYHYGVSIRDRFPHSHGLGQRLLATAPGSGRPDAIVWNSLWDVERSAFRLSQIAYTAQGRDVENPNEPGAPLLEPGRGGIVLRFRTVRGRRRATDWVYTAPFALVSNVAPSLTIDDAVVGDPVLVSWTAFDGDSEDVNGNGVLDILAGEDVNLNGITDFAKVAVAFDYYRLQDGDDPSNMIDADLALLEWLPCTRVAGVGDPDDGVDSSPSPFGRRYTFAWDAARDLVAGGDRVILRARPFDENREHGPWVYRVQVLTFED